MHDVRQAGHGDPDGDGYYSTLTLEIDVDANKAGEVYVEAWQDGACTDTYLGSSGVYTLAGTAAGGIPGDGVADFLYDPATGAMTMHTDGSQDRDEPPREGARVYLDPNFNGEWDADEPSQLTDAEGHCSGPRFLDSPIRCILLREGRLKGGPDEQETADVFGGI